MKPVCTLFLSWLALAVCAVIVPAKTVFAALGDFSDSIAADRTALNAAHQATTERPGYTVHEMQSASGLIREYSSPSKRIFAVAWNGLVPPDLDLLLGNYAEEYRQTLKQQPRHPGRRGSRQVKTDRIVVETWGHMRNLQGRAYVPALVPAGVDINDIK